LFEAARNSSLIITIMSSHNEDEEAASGGIFDAIDAAEDQYETPKKTRPSRASLYRVPVNLYKDQDSGEQYFYLQKSTFPNRAIADLKIIYTQKEKDQVREQVSADKSCPEVLLEKVKVVCWLGGKSSENDDEYLNDESFRLSGSKIAAIRMRMYAKQKTEAQMQLEDPNCDMITLYLDIECRLGSRELQQ
jgi:hypothetical protein